MRSAPVIVTKITRQNATEVRLVEDDNVVKTITTSCWSPGSIPPTLQQSLMARLDQFGPAREVAQIGSVIGRGFSYSPLRDVAGMENAALHAALERLADADIVLVQGLPPQSEYRFKHALIQDAAYANLLKSSRA
jgi:predicted ATPase